MGFKRKNQGSVLIYVLIVAIAMGISLTSMLSASSIEGVNIAQEYKILDRYFAANTGLEVSRGMLYYDTRSTFSTYLKQKDVLATKIFNWDSWNITFDIDNNNVDDGWGDLNFDNDGILEIRSTAYAGKPFVSEGLEVKSQVMLQMTTKYSFANNTFANAYIVGEQHWFGDVYWYSPTGNMPAIQLDSKCIFYNSLRSWLFPASNAARTEYNENFTTHRAYKYDNTATTGNIYTYNSGPMTPDSAFVNAKPFKPLPGITEIGYEFGDKYTPSTIINASYNQIVNGRRTHFFSDSEGIGSISGDVLPDDVELYFHPDGTVWWRQRGEGPLDWRRKDIVQENGVVIYAKGDIWVRGVINKRVVVAAGDDIFINGNIRNSDFKQAHLVLMSKDDIFHEVRREILLNDGTYEMCIPLNEGKKAPVDTNTENFLADRIFTDSEYLAMKMKYPWLSYELDLWRYRPGAMTKNTLIEASIISSDRVVPTARFTNVNADEYYDNSGGRWEVKGTYFIGSSQMPPIDYVENWATAGGSAYYNEHPYARTMPPPFGLTIGNSYPVYRMDGSFWRMTVVNEGLK